MSSNHNQTWLKPGQVNQLRDAVYDDAFADYTKRRNDAIIALAYDAGLRPTEICSVTVAMYDDDDRLLRLTSDVQKDWATETSPPPCAIELAQDAFTSDTVRTLDNYLETRRKDSMFLFPSRKSDHLSTRSLREMVKKAAIQADIKPYTGFSGRGDPSDVSPYTLRHSVAYRLRQARDEQKQVPMDKVKDRLRHRRQSTTEQFYDHFNTV